MRFIEPLNQGKIKSVLSIESKPRLAELQLYSTIDSTNDHLLAYAKTSEQLIPGVICLADEQTKGRGRQGKAWFSPKGSSIYCSLLWLFSAEIDLSQLSLAIAVIIVRALKKYGIKQGLKLKWPNDIYFAQRKLAGILIETLPARNRDMPVVIGLGMNLQLPRENPVAQTSIDIAEIMGEVPERNQLIGLIIHELLMELPVYSQLGFVPFFAEWSQQDYLRGKSVTIHAPQLTITGSAEGVNENGELIIRQSSGEVKTFRCGEVSVKFNR